MPPIFNKSNMNRTKVREIDVITEGHKTVTLQCFTKGLPKPTLTWYKVRHFYFLLTIIFVK